MKKNSKKGFALFLSQRSEIIYLTPAIPCFINLGLSLATAAIYNLEGAHYIGCKNQNSSNEKLDTYLSGTIIINYIFLLIYSNILMEFYVPITDIIISFILLMLYIVMSIIWSALGIRWLKNSKCSSTTYFALSEANIILGFVSVFIILFLSLLKILFTRGKQVQPIDANNDAQEDAKAEGEGEGENVNAILEDENVEEKKEDGEPNDQEKIGDEKESTEKSHNIQDVKEEKKENNKKNEDLDKLLDEVELVTKNKSNVGIKSNVNIDKDVKNTNESKTFEKKTENSEEKELSLRSDNKNVKNTDESKTFEKNKKTVNSEENEISLRSNNKNVKNTNESKSFEKNKKTGNSEENEISLRSNNKEEDDDLNKKSKQSDDDEDDDRNKKSRHSDDDEDEDKKKIASDDEDEENKEEEADD